MIPQVRMSLVELKVVLMFKINGLYSMNYTSHATYQGLVDEFMQLDCEKEDLGVGEDGELHLYGLKYGDFSKPTIFLESNCHGSEWHAAHYAVDFMKRIINRDFYDRNIIDALVDNFSFYVIPSTCPWGYENRSYVNLNGVNLNRNTDNRWEYQEVGEGTVNYKGTAPWSEKEAQIIRDKFLELKPLVAVNGHTTTGAAEGIDVGKRWTEYRALMQDISDSARLSLAKTFEGGTEWSVGYGSTFSGWYGQHYSKEGHKTMSTILEARSDKNDHNYGVTTMFLICIYALQYLKTGMQSINSREELVLS